MATAQQIVKPDLPSTVIRWVGEGSQTIRPGGDTVVAVPITHDWGPLGSEATSDEMPMTSLNQFESIYGTSETAGRTAVTGALRGGDVTGEGGAGGVLVFRMATGSAAAATVTLDNVDDPAADALTLTARYKGARGNRISVTVEDDPTTSGYARLSILFDGAVVERYSYDETDIDLLETLINQRPSSLVTATSIVSGTDALALVSNTALSAGADGSTITSTEWQAALDAYEFRDFGIFSPQALTDSAIKVTIAAWAQRQADEMRPVRVVFGGAAAETVDNVITELTSNASLRNEQIVRFGIGTWHDDFVDADLSTAQLAPRIAGVLASRGIRSALTRARLGGLHLVGSTGATTEELKLARDQGITALRRVTDPEVGLAVSQGVTTFIDRTVAAKPYELFSEPRIVGLFNSFLRGMVAWGDSVVIGDLPVTEDTRDEVRKELRKQLVALEGQGLIDSDWSYDVPSDVDDPLLADAIPFTFGMKPTRTANYLIGEGRVR